MRSAFRLRGSSLASAFLLGATTVLSPIAAFGQSVYGTITGSVTDSSQATVTGAHVVATNPETGFSRETLSNSSGVYTLPNLLPGSYTVTVTATGSGTGAPTHTMDVTLIVQ